MTNLALFATTIVAAWTFMLVARGGFWRADVRLGDAPAPQRWPDVVGVIPARDEAESIGAVVRAHLSSVYPGVFHLIVVDDASSDGTAQIARAAAADIGAADRLTVLDGASLPAGWTGKLWAQAQGIAAARTWAPTYLLLCDADIAFGPETLSRLVARAEAGRLDLVSLMSRLDARGFWAGLLIPAFILFFQKLYPFAWSNDPARRTAAAAGGVMLLRAETAGACDLPAAIRGALIDDCTLAATVKRASGRIWTGLADEGAATSLRDNRSIGSIWSMVARTAYAQLQHSPVLLAGTLLGMAWLYLAAPALALASPLHGDWRAGALGLLGWALMALAFAPTLKDYRKALWRAPLLPFAGALYATMTFSSAWNHWMKRGGRWKGRTYP